MSVKRLQLPPSVSSPQDVQALLADVHEYARWFSRSAIKKRLHAKGKLDSPAISSAASELIRDWEAHKPLTSRSLDELIAALQAFKLTSPTVTIVLAAPPTAGIKKDLVAWCRKNITPNLLVNFEFNATLLGGMVVRCGSHIFDWSFRRQILENRQKFPEVLRNA